MNKHLEFWTETEPVGTALPVLEKAISYFHGPTLEFGMGDFSTPLMTALLQGIEFHSFENDPRWVKHIEEKKLHVDPNHSLHLVDKWGRESEVLRPFMERFWSVIFIDHGSPHRWLEIENFKDRCDIMVVHDADAHFKGGINPMGSTRQFFTFSLEIPAAKTVEHPSPSTVVASMKHDLNKYEW